MEPNEEKVIPIKEEKLEKPEEELLSIVDPIEADKYRQEILSKAWRKSSNRIVDLKVMTDTTVVTTGDGKYIFFIPPELDFLLLRTAYAYITTVSSSGALTIQVRNVTDSVDILSTALTIDANEFSSLTAATSYVINKANDLVQSGDRIAIDVDGAGTGAQGLGVILTFN